MYEKYDYMRVFPVSTSVITSENGTRKFRLINVNTATKNRRFHLNFLSFSAVIFPLNVYYFTHVENMTKEDVCVDRLEHPERSYQLTYIFFLKTMIKLPLMLHTP